MERFDIDEILQDVKNMMEVMGNWPMQNSVMAYTLRMVWISIVMIFSTGSCVQIFMDLTYENVSYGLCCTITASVLVVKFIILYLSKSKFSNILLALRQPCLMKHENYLDTFLKRKIYLCRLLRNTYLSSSAIVLVIMTLSPVPSMNSDRHLPVPFPVDMKSQRTALYLLVWFSESLAAAIICWNDACLNILIFTFIQIAVAQLEMLNTRIINCKDTLSSSCGGYLSNEENPNFIIHRLLQKCVIKHTAIERCINSIEQTFTLTFLVQLIYSLVIFCIVGLNCILFPIGSIQFGRSIVLLVTLTMQLALYCIAGDEITVESEKIGEACYMLQWEKCSPSVRKSMFIIMLRSRRPFKLTALNFTSLSLKTLLTVLKSAYSYFTVLWHLYSKSKNANT